MPCNHKFLDHPLLLEFLPIWETSILILGTFNPEDTYATGNQADFFYQRPRNYFWPVLPTLYNHDGIERGDMLAQQNFLREKGIGLTDILRTIVDADQDNVDHVNAISSFKDDQIDEQFNEFLWNTDAIIKYIQKNKIEEVYFTRLGNIQEVNPNLNTFEYQIRQVENYCTDQSVYHTRLHSPTGMGLGEGERIPTLRQRWIENGFLDHTQNE